jgi:hypothetical protein
LRPQQVGPDGAPIWLAHFLQPIADRFAASVIAKEYEFDFSRRSLTSHF